MRYLMILLLYFIILNPVESCEIVIFGLTESNTGEKRPGLPIYVTEGELPSSYYIPMKNQLEDGVYDLPRVEYNHADRVTSVILQIDPLAKIGGASEWNLKRDAIFNYSYGRNFSQSSELGLYGEEAQILVNRAGYNAVPRIKTLPPSGYQTEPAKRSTQIYIKSAANDFEVGVDPDTYEPKKYKGDFYIQFIDELIGKFGSMGIFCSQMDEDGEDLRNSSSRPLTTAHSFYYICCPTPLFTQRDLYFLLGTSYASPLVSGLVSSLYRDFPALSLQDIRNITLISAVKHYIRWSSLDHSFIKVDLVQRRFSNGLLSRENAYTLARLASQSKIANVDLLWVELLQLSEEMPKQLLIYPNFDVEKNITTYVQWFNLSLLKKGDSDDRVGKNLHILFQSLKFKNYSDLDKFLPYINMLFRGLCLSNGNSDVIYTALNGLLRNESMIVHPHLKSFYELQENIVQKYLPPPHRAPAISHVIFSEYYLGSSHLPAFSKFLKERLSTFCDEFQFMDAEDYLKFYQQCKGVFHSQLFCNTRENKSKL